MSNIGKKIKDEVKAVAAAIDNELTVLEGVPGGYDPLKEEDDDTADEK
ncbi:hypothetical protein HH308_16325 [Gordonia sp. TBRC 11910]|uniref:Uncharacterized protein n=1 Tax=Gordonia asplenii TaxID=2725283 RepID=A0A848L2L3_9ACTN|nr:hypothetical protein [Gordonia asplenii]NMO02781.1 hypothetical protein [Gordonia asplenii]